MCMGMATPVLKARDYVLITDWRRLGLPGHMHRARYALDLMKMGATL